MPEITDEMKELIARTRIFAVGTVSNNGEPNVIPARYIKVLSSDEIMVVNNFMKKTETNIKANSRISISVWDAEAYKGYQFKGEARIETSGKVFDEAVAMVKKEAPRLNSRGAVIVKVKSIYLTTPGRNAGNQVS